MARPPGQTLRGPQGLPSTLEDEISKSCPLMRSCSSFESSKRWFPLTYMANDAHIDAGDLITYQHRRQGSRFQARNAWKWKSISFLYHIQPTEGPCNVLDDRQLGEKLSRQPFQMNVSQDVKSDKCIVPKEGHEVMKSQSFLCRQWRLRATCKTSEPVSRYAHESPTFATSNCQPAKTATVAVVPDTCARNADPF